MAGLVHLTQRLLRPMLKRDHGKIVNNASIAGYAHFPGAVVYSASKAAVVGFSEALRRELSESRVSVLQVVTPGVETRMLEQVRSDYDEHVEDTAKLDGVAPGGVGGEDRGRDRVGRRAAEPGRRGAAGEARLAGTVRASGRRPRTRVRPLTYERLGLGSGEQKHVDAGVRPRVMVAVRRHNHSSRGPFAARRARFCKQAGYGGSHGGFGGL